MPNASIDGVSYPIQAMADEKAKTWMEARLFTFWRQIMVFRKISGTMTGAAYQDSSMIDKGPSGTRKIDEQLTELTSEWLSLNNFLAAMALGFDTDTPTDEQVKLIHSLTEPEKCKVIALQDAANGLDLLKVLADESSKSVERAKADAEKADEAIKNEEAVRVSGYTVPGFREVVKSNEMPVLRCPETAKNVAHGTDKVSSGVSSGSGSVRIPGKLARKLAKRLAKSLTNTRN